MTDYMKEVHFVFMCQKCGTSDDCEEDTLKAAIADFRKTGWIIGRSSNLCPDCRKKEEAEKK